MDDIKYLSSKDGKFIIQIIDEVEPNYGRMLWKVNVFLNGSNINSKLFSENWNHINYGISNLEIENNEFYYVPIEGSAVLIRKNNAEIIKLKSLEISTINFKGNMFLDKFIIELLYNGISITNLQTFENKSHTLPKGKWLSHCEIINNNSLKLHTLEVIDYKKIENTTTVTLT